MAEDELKNLADFSKQSKNAAQAVESLNSMLKNLDQQMLQTGTSARDQAQQLKEISSATSEVADNAKEMIRIQEGMARRLQGLLGPFSSIIDLQGEQLINWRQIRQTAGETFMLIGNFLDKIPKKWMFLAGFVSGFIDSIRMIAKVWKFSFNIMSEVAKVAWDTIKDVFETGVGFVLKLINFVLDAWTTIGSTEFMQALQDLKREFGEFGTGASEVVLNMYKDFGKLRYRFRMFRSEALKFFMEFMQAGPPTFMAIRGQIEKSAEEIFKFQKGMGLSAEQMVMFAKQSLATGEDVKNILTDLARYTGAYADAIGVNRKQISKGVIAAMEDFESFGQLSFETLARSEARLQSLGTTMKDVVGIVKSFDTFKSAADNVSKLTMAFGTQIDTMQLVKAESPAARIDILRQSFERAGLSAEQLNRRQLNLLSGATGLDAQTARLVFSMRNRGRATEDIIKKAKESGKVQKSQKEVLQDLTKAIERLIKTREIKSFWDAMRQGAYRAVRIWGRQTGAMYSYRKALRIVRRRTRDLVKIILNNFPGLNKIAKGFRDLWDPKVFKKLLDNIKKVFQDFFKSWKKDPQEATREFLKGLSEAFAEWSKTTGFSKIKEGVKEVWDAVKTIFGNLIAESIKVAGKKATEGMKWLTKIIAEKGYGGIFEKVKEIGKKQSASFFVPIFRAIGEIFKPLTSALVNLIKTAWDAIDWKKVGDFFMEAKDKILDVMVRIIAFSLKHLPETIWKIFTGVVSLISWKEIAFVIAYSALKGGFFAYLGKAMYWAGKKIRGKGPFTSLFKDWGKEAEKTAGNVGQSSGQAMTKGVERGAKKRGIRLKRVGRSWGTTILGGLAAVGIASQLAGWIADAFEEAGKKIVEEAKRIAKKVGKIVRESNKEIANDLNKIYGQMTEEQRKRSAKLWQSISALEQKRANALARRTKFQEMIKGISREDQSAIGEIFQEFGGAKDFGEKLVLKSITRSIDISRDELSFLKQINELAQEKGVRINSVIDLQKFLNKGYKNLDEEQRFAVTALETIASTREKIKGASIQTTQSLKEEAEKAWSKGDIAKIIEMIDPEKAQKMVDQMQIVLKTWGEKKLSRRDMKDARIALKDLSRTASFMGKLGDVSFELNSAFEAIAKWSETIEKGGGVSGLSIGLSSLNALLMGIDNLYEMSGKNVAGTTKVLETLGGKSAEIVSIFSALTGGSGSVTFQPGKGKIDVHLGVNLNIDGQRLSNKLYDLGAVWAPGRDRGANSPKNFKPNENLKGIGGIGG